MVSVSTLLPPPVESVTEIVELVTLIEAEVMSLFAWKDTLPFPGSNVQPLGAVRMSVTFV
jgi:hypothetical protein